ncbi:GDSL esterase/lipase 1-like [Prunus avium]|uniref:GDSL esterase/lipase 1-like n=1 Tax=Prunus avium TaxID=42229 RepID=A0A6P5U244_PRUAV|nr:GDSL esterase/lipase 1-like [Prunus avium]
MMESQEVEFAEYAKLPYLPPYLQPGLNNYTYGVNFASAHQGYVSDLASVIHLKTQLCQFKKVVKQLRHKLGHAEAKTILSKAVYLISIGNNDYFAPFTSNSSLFESHSHKEFVGLVIGNLKKVIKVIYTVLWWSHTPNVTGPYINLKELLEV